jgi:GT2 family glycosyltransferase
VNASESGRLVVEGFTAEGDCATISRHGPRQTGPFDESLATREDQDLWIRMREQAGVVAVPDALVVVHARERASESGRDWPRIRADYFAILERALARRPDLYGPHIREIRAEAAWHWGLMALKAGDCAAARRALWRSLLTAPRLRTVPPALASLLPSALVSRLLRLRP